MAAKTRTNLTSLERLERQLQAITPDRAQGDAWEKALKGWINAGGHPELTKAWMWGEWPGKLKAGLKGDKGVDLVAETRDKQLVAIQVKFRRDPNDPVTAPEVQKLVGSYRKHFTLFALASNAWSATRGVSEAVGDEDAMLILREQLLESSYDWAAKKSIKRTKFTPFPFQKVAAENVRKALVKGGRAQIVMACGTGKTVTMLLAAEALDAQRVLVLAPTLLLVKQLRDEWVSKRRPDREWASLAVCSDIGDGVDASEIAPAEFGAPPTTNPDDIAAFLKKPGRRVVFGTYASSDRIAKAQKKAGVPSFDLAVADEAHRIAGVVSAKDKSERSQRVMLEEKEIKAVRRLFATATPRITGSKKTRDGDEILIESMDDESRFGRVAHSVTFQEAVKLKRLVPYKLVVTIVTNDEVAEAVQNRRFIDVNGKPYAADEVATAIAIRRAYKDLGISKIISYHSRVAGARAFADLITKVPGRGKAPVTEHVAGSMPVNDRRQVLNRLAAATEPYLVTNARCLTEGIDVPALDAVAFADPRRSQVDIVQAVGRAMRRPMGKSTKTTGYIILPVYLTKKELKDPETAVEGSAFEPVLQVLRALKDHDPFMARSMAKVLVGKGKKPHKKGEGIDEFLEVSISAGLDKVLAKRLLDAVQLRAIEVSAGWFEIGFAHLVEYFNEYKHVRIPNGYHSPDGFPLNIWRVARVGEYNGQRGGLDPEKARRLESIPGWTWDKRADLWNAGLEELRVYHQKFGNTLVATDWISPSGFKLGNWVMVQRRAQKVGRLSSDRAAQLESLQFVWNKFAHSWESHFHALEVFRRREGHAAVTANHFEGGLKLGQWCVVQRTAFSQGNLSRKRKERLDALGFLWVHSAIDDNWKRAYQALVAWKKETGSTLVPQGKVFQGISLGNWVLGLRNRRKAGKVSKTQITELDKLDFIWDPFGATWQRHFEALSQYIKKTGDTDPSTKTRADGLNIGSWLNRQRTEQRMGNLPGDKARRLKAIGVDFRIANDRLWELGFGVLQQYKKEHGHLNVPSSYEKNGVRLASWMQTRRNDFRSGRLDASKITALEAVGFEWERLDAWWLPGYESYKQYVTEKGPGVPPQSTVVNGFKLGTWLSTRRLDMKRGRLSPERVKALEQLGMIWDLEEQKWSEFLRHLAAFVKRFGHGNVPQAHVEGNYPLGSKVAHLRGSKKLGKLEPKKVREANAAGMVWSSGRYKNK